MTAAENSSDESIASDLAKEEVELHDKLMALSDWRCRSV